MRKKFGWDGIKKLLGGGKVSAPPGRTAAGKLADATNTYLLKVKRTQAAGNVGSDATIGFLNSMKATGKWDTALIDKHIASMKKSVSLSGVDISPEAFSQLMNNPPGRVQANLSGNKIEGLHPGNPNKKFDDFGSAWRGIIPIKGILATGFREVGLGGGVASIRRTKTLPGLLDDIVPGILKAFKEHAPEVVEQVLPEIKKLAREASIAEKSGFSHAAMIVEKGYGSISELKELIRHERTHQGIHLLGVSNVSSFFSKKAQPNLQALAKKISQRPFYSNKPNAELLEEVVAYHTGINSTYSIKERLPRLREIFGDNYFSVSGSTRHEFSEVGDKFRNIHLSVIKKNRANRIQSNISGHAINGIHGKFDHFGTPWKGIKSMLGIGGKTTAKGGLDPAMKKVYASRQLTVKIDKFRKEIPGIGTDIVHDFVNAAKKLPEHDPATLDKYMSQLTQTITMSENAITKEEFASLMMGKLSASSFNANAKVSVSRNRNITKSRKTPSY